MPWRSDQRRLEYRPDIDGLRALSVFSVVGFHAFPGCVTGGYVGVDVLIHALIFELARKDSTDEQIYREIQERLPEIKPVGSELTYALPALKKQKAEMTRESLELLGPLKAVNGYLEIGTTGRYVSELRHKVRIVRDHDVFNAGVALTWEENHRQLRLFRSIDQWTRYLVDAGFKRTETRRLVQKGDPTKNLLFTFARA